MAALKDLLSLSYLSLESVDEELATDVTELHEEINHDVEEADAVESATATLESLVLVLESHRDISNRELKLLRYAAESELSCVISGKPLKCSLESMPESTPEETKAGIGAKIKSMVMALINFIRSIYNKVKDFILRLVDGCRGRSKRATDMIEKLKDKENSDAKALTKESADSSVHSYTLVIGDKPHDYEGILKLAESTANHVLDVSKYEAAVKAYVAREAVGENALPLIPPMASHRLPGRPTIDFVDDDLTLKFKLTEDMPQHPAVGVPVIETKELIRIAELVRDISDRVVKFGDAWRQFDRYIEHQLSDMLRKAERSSDMDSGKLRKLRNLFKGFAQAPRGYSLYSARLAEAAFDYVKYCYNSN